MAVWKTRQLKASAARNFLIAASTATAISFAAHAEADNPPTRVGNGIAFLSDFSNPDARNQWFISNHKYVNEWLRTTWSPSQTRFADGALSLSIRRDGDKDDLLYVGGEVQQAQRFYSFGRYEVAMRPAAGSGMISSFFTHTDSYFGDPHDEIDIEFVGRDSRIVYLNSFADGDQWGPKIIDLPFNAAEETHLYAFDWRPDRITWFIDGAPVHTVTSEEVAIPQTPQRLMMNIWSGGKAQWAWHGKPKFEDGASAVYECVSFTPLGEDAPKCSDSWTPAS